MASRSPSSRALPRPALLSSTPLKARVSSDGMGRAAAAGTGLFANVVAGVGSAIGATRTGTEEERFAGGGGGGGAGDGGRGDGAGPLVQLYRRADAGEPSGRAAGAAAAAATTQTHISTSSRGNTNSAAGSSSTLALSEPERAEVVPRNRDSSNSRKSSEVTADTGDAVREDGGTERYSAFGVASATGGAMLRGLWGGVQSAAAAGVAVAAGQGSSGGGGGASGGGEQQPPPEFRLYRREGDT